MRLRAPLLVIAAAAVACHGRSGSNADAGPAAVASTDLTAARKPPALRAPHPGAPALPDLPALMSHEPPATSPAGADLGDSPCHAVWTGSEAAPLACARSLLFGADQGGGAVPLVARKLLSHDPASLPAVVDHRLDGTEGPVRNQSSAPACTAFAAAAAIDHALARWGGGNPAVSVMEIWSRYHSPEVETSLSSNVGQQLGPEQQWPFRAAEATTWVPCSDFARPPRSGCGNPVDEAHARAVLATPVGELTEVEYLGTSADTGMLQAKIAAGQDVLITMELPSAFVPRGQAGARYVPNYTKSAGPDAGHAMVIAGYVHLPHGTYFLLHNSWGPGWGDGGYAWIHETTLRRWACRDDLRRRPRPRQHPRHVRARVPRSQPPPRWRLCRRRAVSLRLRQSDGRLRAGGADGERQGHGQRRHLVVRSGRMHLRGAARERSRLHRGAVPCVVSRAGLHPGQDGRRAGVRGVSPKARRPGGSNRPCWPPGDSMPSPCCLPSRQPSRAAIPRFILCR